jgi:hypothetical protein
MAETTGFLGANTSGYVASGAVRNEPTEERLAELKAQKENPTILGMNAPQGSSIPVGYVTPDANGVVPTGQAAIDAINDTSEKTGTDIWSTIYKASPGAANTVFNRNTTREDKVKQDALLSMGFNPNDTTEEQFLSQEGMSQLYQEKINLFAYGTENPTFREWSVGDNTISTATKASEQLDTYSEWAKQKASVPAVETATGSPSALEQQMLDLIKGQIDSNTAYNTELIDNLKEQSLAAQKAQEVQNRLTQGQSAWQLAKMGALGTTMSGQDYLLSVEQSGLDKLNKLALDYQDKILEAEKAMQDGNYAASADLMEFAMKIEERISDEKQQQFQNSLDLADEMRKQEEFNRSMVEWAQGDISNLITAGFAIEDFSNEDKREYEAKAGYPPGTFDKLYDAVKTVQDANTYDAQLEADKKKYDILKDIPQTTEVMVGGKWESGLKQVSPNVWEQIITDASGAIKLVTYDENTGEMMVHETGVNTTAKGSSGGGGGGGSYTGSTTSLSGTELKDVVDRLYYDANGNLLSSTYSASAMRAFNQQLANDVSQIREQDMAVLQQKAKGINAGNVPSSIYSSGTVSALLTAQRSDSDIANTVINAYFSDPAKNPFYRKTAPETSVVTEEDAEGNVLSTKTTVKQ